MFFISFWIIAPSKHSSSSSELFYEIGVIKNLSNFTGKHLRQSLFLQLYYYRDSGAGVFLWILEQF